MNHTKKRFFPTDQGNSERFAATWRGIIMYVRGIGWHLYDRGRWNRCEKGEEVECAKKTVRQMYREAANHENEEYRVELAEWASKCESEKRLMSMIHLAQSDPAIAVSSRDLDKDPFSLNVLNGTINLRDGNLRPHNPADLCTKQSPIKFDQRAECRLFLAFMDRIFADKQNLIRHVQKLLGNAISGDATTQLLPICYGEGANGKSTLLGIVGYILADYAGIAPDSLLTSNGRQEHPTELADLQGVRFVVASETERGDRLNIQRVKQLTGENIIKARRMRQDFFEFQRTHHIFMQTNNLPRISEDGEATWRRIQAIPFNVVIPTPERDPQLMEKLKGEASGILSWLVLGCIEWQREGLVMPTEAEDATRHYREESDPIGDFVNDCCTLGPEVSTPSGQLRLAYEEYCKTQGYKPIGGRLFTQRLEKLGGKAGRNYRGRFWTGIGLLTDAYSEAVV